ncbi:MAG: DUF3368 domain-containing protein [Acidobacteriota bacterium]
MPELTVISNTSPLLYLHQVGQLGLLRQLYQQVLVPAAVEAELKAGRERGVEVPLLSRLDWVELRDVVVPRRPADVSQLGAGEAGVITLALSRQPCLLLLDDRPARRLAAAQGLASTGTLGILLKAKADRLIPMVSPVLDELKKTTMWLNDELIGLVLAEAREGSRRTRAIGSGG